MPHRVLIDGVAQVTKHRVNGVEIAIYMFVGLRKCRIERGTGDDAAIQHHLGEQRPDFLSLGKVESEMTERRNSRDVQRQISRNGP